MAHLSPTHTLLLNKFNVVAKVSVDASLCLAGSLLFCTEPGPAFAVAPANRHWPILDAWRMPRFAVQRGSLPPPKPDAARLGCDARFRVADRPPERARPGGDHAGQCRRAGTPEACPVRDARSGQPEATYQRGLTGGASGDLHGVFLIGCKPRGRGMPPHPA